MLVLPTQFNSRAAPANGLAQERSAVKSYGISQMLKFPARTLPAPLSLSVRQGNDVADQAASAYCSFAVIWSIDFCGANDHPRHAVKSEPNRSNPEHPQLVSNLI